ncbi:MAG: hypothetical protein PHZ07_02435 [Patescibacteria group bacterium]|nr:hypothetical protein [Patescibacteria group bacterium]MDD4304257.1 hypothetical protein [Patescibacteria group bacterium]MDD4695311.1 hypothetical protein [Patescibacteria group bacterium]
MVEKEKIEIGSQEKINIDLGKILEHDSNIDNIIEKEQEKTREENKEKPNVSKNVSDDLSTTVLVQDIKVYDEVLSKKIENILEEGLSEFYMNMPEDKKLEFKEKGEETANKISILLKDVKVKVKKIIGLIIDWLNVVPKVNKFFVKQTAKIKTDKILELNNLPVCKENKK